jgi:alpha,alpha-trehalose phosphorylase
MDHVIDGPDEVRTRIESEDDLARLTMEARLAAGETLRVLKFVTYGWSSTRSQPALRDQAEGALAAALGTGWEQLRCCQREWLDQLWSVADVEIDGDAELQLAVRYAVFSIVQASARAEQRAISAKGLTGSGYDGHTFWDSETYTLRALSYLLPSAVSDALRWRHATIGMAADRAQELGLQGVAFPWRTIAGRESSGYWPASTAAFHINADIADAVRRYVRATDDEEFAAGPGLELAVQTARLWRSLGHHDASACFRIDGVTGPDEYTALCDNNVYTNLMAARNFEVAAHLAARHIDRAADLGVDHEEIADWRNAAAAIKVPVDAELGVTPQCDGFTRYRRWDFDAASNYPLLLHHHNYVLYSSQVVKQADLVLALFACGDRFEPEQKLRDFDFYERITVRDSSLSAPIQAIVAAEVGYVERAYDYLRETALIDLRDLAENTGDGLHLAAQAGAWLGVAAGLGGMRDHGERLSFAPRLPPQLAIVSFGLRYRGRCLRVRIEHHSARYELSGGDPLELDHYGETVTVADDAPRSLEIPRLPDRSPPPPPPGREPAARDRAHV